MICKAKNMPGPPQLDSPSLIRRPVTDLYPFDNVGHLNIKYAPMIHGFLADLTIVLHFVWILFLICGFIPALLRPKIAFLHLAGLLFALLLNIMGWYCPLTYVEDCLRSLSGPCPVESGSAIIACLYHLIYPELPENYIRIGGILFTSFYVGFYAWLAKRYHIFEHVGG
jgi:hypothetical protein